MRFYFPDGGVRGEPPSAPPRTSGVSRPLPFSPFFHTPRGRGPAWRRGGLGIAVLPAIFYALLCVILQMNDCALLMGKTFILIVLDRIMWFRATVTRTGARNGGSRAAEKKSPTFRVGGGRSAWGRRLRGDLREGLLPGRSVLDIMGGSVHQGWPRVRVLRGTFGAGRGRHSVQENVAFTPCGARRRNRG